MLEDEEYVDGVIDGRKTWKNGREVLVIAIEPILLHVLSERWSCSATAKVVRYQGYKTVQPQLRE